MKIFKKFEEMLNTYKILKKFKQSEDRCIEILNILKF